MTPSQGELIMPRNLVVALANCVEGRVAESNDWYDNQHLADVLAVPGSRLRMFLDLYNAQFRHPCRGWRRQRVSRIASASGARSEPT